MCGINSTGMKIITNSFSVLDRLKTLNLGSKFRMNTIIDNPIGDDGCKAVFQNIKYIYNLECLKLNSRTHIFI